MSETPLSRLMPGDHGTIVRIATTKTKVRTRLMEMGLTKGTSVELVRFAPMGDPIEVKVKGYRLSLRREEAESVFVHKNSA